MLRLTKLADYGIVLMTQLVGDPERRFAAPELSALTHIPLPMVSKILKQLVREELLESHRGAKGGYTLALPPDKISVARMIEALDGPIAFTECIEEAPGECSQEAFCQLRAQWQLINRTVRSALEDISLAELAHPVPAPLIQLGQHAALGGSSDSKR